MYNHSTEFLDVLVIGCGGAGLRSAIEIKKNNLSVCVLGKRSRLDAHTGLAAGGINAALGNLDKNDSWQQHFIDTYLEGYKLGDTNLIKSMAKFAPDAVREVDSWGANFDKLKNGEFNQRYFGAHSYRRTCFSGDYTGRSILNALLKKSEELKIPIFDSQYVTDLLVKENRCYGAMSFNILTGQRTIYRANAVVLCTGGHTRIWKKSSSRIRENLGDGLALCLKVGGELMDMEMVQFHPTGMLFPEDHAGTLVTEAVRGEGGKLFNGKGERFMVNYDKERMELSSRDRVAIANYTEIVQGRTSTNGGVYLDISHIDKKIIMTKLPKIYELFLSQQSIDITKEPMEVAPTAHYSMGGIVVDNEQHQVKNIKGLFAAGEVAGGLHGANRLGGNSLAEILVFGKIAGRAASEYSKKYNEKIDLQSTVRNAHDNINQLIKNGEYEISSLNNELREIMWEHCGVVKNNMKLVEGLKKINILKNKSDKVNVAIADHFNDLVDIFDLKSSIISAEATMLSAKSRNESRGAHNRDDYKETDEHARFNNIIKLQDNKLKHSTEKINKLDNYLYQLIQEKHHNIIQLKEGLIE